MKNAAAVDIGISRLLQMQRDDGGFALWDKEGPEEYWLTAYAMDFLRAGEQGYSVPVKAMNNGNHASAALSAGAGADDRSLQR
jgi:uncharacterized protein YfaS (alpha-2-macroglobulin family)